MVEFRASTPEVIARHPSGFLGIEPLRAASVFSAVTTLEFGAEHPARASVKKTADR
jgi:hypothetical protein